MTKNVVVSFYNTPSGMFSWWDQFPKLITEELKQINIDHIIFYKNFTENSIYKKDYQRTATNEDLNSIKWLRSKIIPLCKKYNKVIIHTHSHYPPIKVWALTYLLPNCEWHITEHRIATGNIPTFKRLFKVLLRKFGLLPKQVIGVSQAVKKSASMSFGSKNIKTIYNGVDLQQYSVSHNHRLSTSAPMKYLYIGRMDEKKGVFELIEAFKLIKKNEIAASLTIVGGGKILGELKKLSLSYHLNDIIHFKDYQSDVKTFYKTHDAVIIPTKIEEALSLVAIEAKAMGLPVIYANKGGLPEVFQESKSGIMLLNSAARDISDAVSRLNHDEALYKDLASRSKSDLDKFSLEKMIHSYISHYENTFKQM